MAQVSIDEMQRLLDQWPTFDQVLEVPDFMGMWVSRTYWRCLPCTDDMRQMLDDLGIEPGVAIERIDPREMFPMVRRI